MPTDRENLYKIDTSGQVWTINVSGKGSIPPTWALLPNPTKMDLKRISSRNSNVLWGVSSDHQIYVYVCKPDIPIRVKMETYENQRWFPVDGFSHRLLPTDRPHFSSEDGTTEKTKASITLPSDCWEWEGDWLIETLFEGQVLDAEGWTYAVDFPASYHSEKSWKSCVRRRKWFRTRRFIGYNKWQRICPIHEDFTQEPFTDVCASTYGVSSPDISCVWAVTVLGQVYFRTNVSSTNPEGNSWHHVPIKKGMEACQITVTSTGVPFVVAWTGALLYRTGLTPHNLVGTEWVEANGPRDNGLLQVSAGTSALWGITRDRKCWALKGDLQDCISKLSTTFDWIEIPRKLKSISVSKSDQVVLGLGEEDDEIYVRFGIARDQQHGQGWRKAFPGPEKWDSVSTSSSDVASLDQTDDGPDGGGSSGESMISIRPSFPKVQVDGDLSRKGICWVDGGCLSMLKFTSTETDLEVGPWREDILNNLQSVQSSRVQFQYPEAVDKSEFISWSKSTMAFMLQHGSDTVFTKGQLEILNNDTIVFHKNLNHRWVCAMQDVLSVLYTRELTFTLRIRNSIEVGVSDFISFKFSNEKECEDWYHVVNELAQKNPEDMTMVNGWMTTTQGEVLDCGFVKISDSPLEGEIITPTNTENRTHHPLIKGFLPGSSIRLDISIPVNAESFSMNLEGRTYTAFHFNPRFESACVVRNTMSHGQWGEEERDGVFPFITGHSYIVTIECTDTHIITTVSVQRKQFIFNYRHRVPPKYITSFSAGGNINILGIRYDPKSGHDSSQPEFTTKPVPGHFWKVEAARTGFVWAISFDYNVWVYTLSSKDQKKFESDSFNSVTDDAVVVIYENQRWNPITGFGHVGLPTDRSPWSDETGRIAMDKETVKLRSYKWKWISDWEIDYSVKNGVDEDGWQYAIDFPASYHSHKRFNDFVRRRRWKRVSRYVVDGPWQLVPGVQLVDLTISMNDDCEWEVLGATKNGDAVVRCGITAKNPAGSHWEQISGEKQFISVSSWFGHKYWAVGKDGYAYIRYTSNWQMLDKPDDSRLKMIRVGPNGDVWAVGTNNTLYRRTNIVHPALPEGKDWCEACKGVLNISFGPDGTLHALLKKKGSVYPASFAKRVGVLQDTPNGIGWDMIAEGPWSHLSMCGARAKSA